METSFILSEEYERVSATDLFEKQLNELEQETESEISILKLKRIRCDMVYNLRYDATEDESEDTQPEVDLLKWIKPCAMIVFRNSDLNSAACLAAKAAQMPFTANTIAVVIVEQSVRERFIRKIRNNLKPLEPNIANNDIFKRTLEAIKIQNVATVTAPEDVVPAELSPVLVCDVIQNDLSYGASGAVALHTFSTVNEILKALRKESLGFYSITIWHKYFANDYALIARMKPYIFYINCHGNDLAPVRAQFESSVEGYVTIAKNYHYEVIMLGNKKVMIVFPVGTIFAN